MFHRAAWTTLTLCGLLLTGSPASSQTISGSATGLKGDDDFIQGLRVEVLSANNNVLQRTTTGEKGAFTVSIPGNQQVVQLRFSGIDSEGTRRETVIITNLKGSDSHTIAAIVPVQEAVHEPCPTIVYSEPCRSGHRFFGRWRR